MPQVHSEKTPNLLRFTVHDRRKNFWTPCMSVSVSIWPYQPVHQIYYNYSRLFTFIILFFMSYAYIQFYLNTVCVNHSQFLVLFFTFFCFQYIYSLSHLFSYFPRAFRRREGSLKVNGKWNTMVTSSVWFGTFTLLSSFWFGTDTPLSG